ncbi:TylF/MycF/NovP-related O-methyltransferase [Pelagicoccus enzymogenes]|nr:TylF/MycF/NovP-related O-methyltransferase [Pelagicoccus enzymogenes]
MLGHYIHFFEVIAFCDNDPTITGSTIQYIPIVHPALLAELDFDYLVIDEAYPAMINQAKAVGVANEKIKLVQRIPYTPEASSATSEKSLPHFVIVGEGQQAMDMYLHYREFANITAFCSDQAETTPSFLLQIPVLNASELPTFPFDLLIIDAKNVAGIQQAQELGIPAERIELFSKQNKRWLPIIEKETLESICHLDLPTQETMKNLYLGVAYIFSQAVEGDIAEFGCSSTGKSTMAIAQAISQLKGIMPETKSPRKLLLFDSFQGLPKSNSEADTQSPLVESGIWAHGTLIGIPRIELAMNLERIDKSLDYEIFKGWFSETLQNIPPGTKLAMVHLDCDLYESTLQVLDYLFTHQHLSEGCTLYFDDWNCNRASDEFGQRKAWSEIVAKFNPSFSDMGHYSWAGHRKILHSF